MKANVQIGASAPVELEEDFNSLAEVIPALEASHSAVNPVIDGERIIFESKLPDESLVFGFATLS